jgi:hypothetical protein
MNYRRGLFRLWIAASLLWAIGTAWAMRVYLALDCSYFSHHGSEDLRFECLVHPAITEARAIVWIVLPPFAVLALGIWVSRGFLPK